MANNKVKTHRLFKSTSCPTKQGTPGRAKPTDSFLLQNPYCIDLVGGFTNRPKQHKERS